MIHHGIVLKINANVRYATDSVGQAIIKVIADRCGVPI
jgi:aspartyl aminopeptidase